MALASCTVYLARYVTPKAVWPYQAGSIPFHNTQGSVGATIRVYIEAYQADKAKLSMPTGVALKDLVNIALSLSKIKEFTGRDAPTVIT